MLFSNITRLLLIPLAVFCGEKNFLFPCYNDTLAVYVSFPDTEAGAHIYFVPSPGYMDHNGNLGVGKKNFFPDGGVYDVWKNYLNSLGYSVISFDKPGTGASSGRLSQQEEAAFVCVFSSLRPVLGRDTKPYFIFTYSSGFDFFRYALPSIRKDAGKDPAGVIFLAGLPSWYTSVEDGIPILSVVGDTSLCTRNIKKAGMMFQANWDTLSQVFIVPHADVNLCDSVFKSEENRCRYSSILLETVGEWMATITAISEHL